jgi:MtN3 and saliva related transmembrane protein
VSAFAAVPADALGFAAGTLTTIAFVPQLLRILKTRSAHDISWWMFGILIAGVALWLWYGIRVDAPPVIVANAVTLALAVAIVLLKRRYHPRVKPPRVAPKPGRERRSGD